MPSKKKNDRRARFEICLDKAISVTDRALDCIDLKGDKPDAQTLSKLISALADLDKLTVDPHAGSESETGVVLMPRQREDGGK